MLYQATDEPSYLTDATRLYQWARTHTQQSDGLFLEKYYLTGSMAGTAGDFTLVNAAGDAISTLLEFYSATGGHLHLQEAQRIATRSLSRFFNQTTGAINDEGFWAFELLDALNDLSRADNNPLWLAATRDALEWLHSNRRDPNGHYGGLWGRGGFQSTALTSWHLNDQAAVARSYLHTGLTAMEYLRGDFNSDGVVDAADYIVWRDGRGRNYSLNDYNAWRMNFSQAAGSGAASPGLAGGSYTSVPEPTSMATLLFTLGLANLSAARYAGRYGGRY